VVKPEDVRSSIERGFKLRSRLHSERFRGVVGGEACARRPATCELSGGIVTDPAANTVTFHLTRPDPEFLLKLADPNAFVVPAGTPAKDVGTSPVPATGPYMIQSFVPRQTLVLVRNPRFREWSRAAQPDGYPDRMEWKPSGQAGSPIGEHAAVDAVLRGRADFFGLALEQPPGDRVEELTTRYASQAHLYPYLGQFAMYLNTRVPPFDDPRVRRALSYAVDRNAVQQLYPGPAQVTCQYWPPNFPGYQPYCPHTLNPNPAGAWTAPDRATAMRLIKESGTSGMRVTVWSAEGFVDVSRYFVKLLDSLGYDARLRIIGPDSQRGFDKFLGLCGRLQEQGPDGRLLVPRRPVARRPHHRAQVPVVCAQQRRQPEHRRVLQPPARRQDRAGPAPTGHRPHSGGSGLGGGRPPDRGPGAGHPTARPPGDRPGVQAGRQLPAKPGVGSHPQPAVGHLTSEPRVGG
jgi:extracellular solute-binding protein (family 5)